MHRLLIASILLAACKSSTAPAPDDFAAVFDLGGDATMPTFEVLGYIGSSAELTDGGNTDGGVAVGAQVCLVGYPYCASADSVTGAYGLNVPDPAIGMSIQLAASVIADTYLGATIFGTIATKSITNGDELTQSSWLQRLYLLPAAAASTLLTGGGLTYPSTTTGYVSLRIVDASSAPLAGATVTLAPASGKTVYADATGALNAALTSTSASGVVVIGNVDPKAFTVTVSAAGLTCTPLDENIWPGTAASSINGTVVAGTMTETIVMACK